MNGIKICTKCGLEKPLSEFNKSGFRKGKQVYKSRCKQCLSEETTMWYNKGGGKETRHKRYEIDQKTGKRKQRRDNRQAVLIEYMGGKCQRCGITGDDVVWHFDHKDPMTKSHNINRQDSYDKSFKELEKCQLLCFKCHLEKTFKDDFEVIMKKKYGGS
tara:strand:+ start:43 stop:519 length:477 start_codon:yes stop_codon:yes gene_type:complete